MGMTQMQLGDLSGVGFQQIQKYETAANRVAASRLWEIAAAQSVPITYYFAGLQQAEQESSCTRAKDLDDEITALVRYFLSIPKEKRKKLSNLARAMSISHL